MQITKLDKRHAGREDFAYYVTVDRKTQRLAREEFITWRLWCEEQWGKGIELSWVYILKDQGYNIKWAWVTDAEVAGTLPRIYLRGDEEMTLFKLRW